jgi:hypothetical protein
MVGEAGAAIVGLGEFACWISVPIAPSRMTMRLQNCAPAAAPRV